MSPLRLYELLREKGRLIGSTVVPTGYVITDDGRDPDIHEITVKTEWDRKTNPR